MKQAQAAGNRACVFVASAFPGLNKVQAVTHRLFSGGGVMAKPGPWIKSVFQEGESTSKSLFTQKWIALINLMEKEKEQVYHGPQAIPDRP